MDNRQLDALVAQARGWKRMRWCDWQKDARTSLTYSWHDETGKMTELAEDCDDYYNPTPAWSPSTDIASAMALVEELVATGLNVELHWRGGAVSCSVEEGDEVTAHYIAVADAPTASEAICLAYLKAKGVEV